MASLDSSYSYKMQELAKINERIRDLLNELPSFCSDYLYQKTASNKFQPRTKLSYLGDILTFFKWLHTSHELFMDTPIKAYSMEQMKQITTADITAFLASMDFYESESGIHTNSAASKSRKLAAIRSLFSFFVSNKGFTYNVASYVETPRIKTKDIVYMSTEQQGAFLENVNAGKRITNSGAVMKYEDTSPYYLRDRAIIALFLGTGIRISELVGIDVVDLDFRDSSVHIVRKGGNEQKVFFSSDVEDAILSYLDYGREILLKGNDDESALFLSQRSGRIAVRSVQEIVSRYTEYTFGSDSKTKISPHKLRSTYASNLLEETDNIYLVANALGHSDLSTVQKYAKIKDMQRAAISLRSKDK